MKYTRLLFAAFSMLNIGLAVANPATPMSDGLSVALHVDSLAVRMGAAIDFHTSLTFDTTAASPTTRILNRFSERCQFSFIDKRTGEIFHRVPFSEGMPMMMEPGNLVRLTHGARFTLQDLKVYLLSDAGEQIPPGSYEVTLTYLNDGGDKKEAYLDYAHQYQQRLYSGPWQLWSGTVESEPIPMTVLPASPSRVEFVVPSAMVVDTTLARWISAPGPAPKGPRPIQIAWWCNPDSTQIVHVVKRPGFALGNRWHLESRVGGRTVSEFPRGWGGLLNTSGKSFLDPTVSSQLLAGTDSELILHMEVFETSDQPKHGWSPEQGDFKVLWSGRVRHRAPHLK